MATKRPAGEDSPVPPSKKPLLTQAPLHVIPATCQEDLDIKILQIQNKKLSERLKERNHRHELLQQRVDRLEEEKEGAIEVIVHVDQNLRSLLQELQAQLGLNTEETILSSLTNLSNQSTNAATNSLDQFFSSLSSSISNRGAQLFSQLQELKETVAQSSELKPSTVEELEKIVTKRQQSLDALEELKEQLDPTEVQKVKGRVEVLESKCKRLENDLADARFDLEKSLIRNERLEKQLAVAIESTRSIPSPSEHSSGDGGEGIPEVGPPSIIGTAVPPVVTVVGGGNGEKSVVTNEEIDSLKGELEEAQKLAESRLSDSDQLTQQIVVLKQLIEKEKLASQQVPETSIRNSPAYKTIQSQYSVLMMEHQQLRACYEEAKKLLNTAKTQHIMQLEEIRQEELRYQIEVRDEMSQLETTIASTKRDYELLKIDYERTLAANEQAAPIANELQHMVTSLQKNIQQLKGEASRYKSRAHKAEEKLNKIHEDKEKKEELKVPDIVAIPQQELSTQHGGDEPQSTTLSHLDDITPPISPTSQPNEEVEMLQTQVNTLESEKKALEIKMEELMAASKEQKERSELIVAEKKAKQHADELKKRLDEARKEYEKKKEHLREDNKQLQKEVNNKKQEAQALMAEMDSIAQAFEEMQEQNIRLLQQLKEKNDANFKLMSERIKFNSLHKILAEEKQLILAEVAAITGERDRLNNLVQKLEDRDKNSEAAIAATEKELNLRQQLFELHKKKAIEASHQLQEVSLKISELEETISAAQKSLLSKTEECEKETQNTKKAQEEIGTLKRKLEKYRHREWATMSDEVLVEEIKTYRNKLNCPVCTSRKKDTVLTKCFHVFCAECIKTRYETRQRKCPKCNAAFGANDFHKIYLS